MLARFSEDRSSVSLLSEQIMIPITWSNILEIFFTVATLRIVLHLIYSTVRPAFLFKEALLLFYLSQIIYSLLFITLIKNPYGEFRLNIIEMFPRSKIPQLFTSIAFLFVANVFWFLTLIPFFIEYYTAFPPYNTLSIISFILFIIVFNICLQTHILIGMHPGDQAKNFLVISVPLLGLGVFVPQIYVPSFLLAYMIILIAFTQRLFPDME
ncbi:MAG: hypothetical protein JXA60_01340 [Candidatus Coatesbacteria bacterium]|nr:hypothetical protein [Candidatus Coatesbacteria bacterium]